MNYNIMKSFISSKYLSINFDSNHFPNVLVKNTKQVLLGFFNKSIILKKTILFGLAIILNFFMKYEAMLKMIINKFSFHIKKNMNLQTVRFVFILYCHYQCIIPYFKPLECQIQVHMIASKIIKSKNLTNTNT